MDVHVCSIIYYYFNFLLKMINWSDFVTEYLRK